MPVLKLWNQDGVIALDDGYLKNFDEDPRARLMPRDAFLAREYRIRKGVYMTKSSFIMRLALNDDPTITALYCTHRGRHIIILPENAMVFYDGRSVEPRSFNMRSSLQAMATIPARLQEIERGMPGVE